MCHQARFYVVLGIEPSALSTIHQHFLNRPSFLALFTHGPAYR